MFQALRERVQNKDDRGFTLIELMVVVLIIAILIAIAIPTFLGARTKAQDRATQSDLRTAMVTAQAFYTDNETFLDPAAGGTAATTAVLYEADEPSIAFVAGAATQADTEVGVLLPTSTEVLLVKESKSGTWYCAVQRTDGAASYGSGAAFADVDTEADCADVEW